jgi:MHS family alpha-ketoglutarate permease-like MFS transporter
VGGEYGTTATYMSEVALKGQRGFFASFQYVTLIGGQLLAVLVVVILQQLLSEDELRAWGWRIPFVVGAVAALISLMLRRTLKKPPARKCAKTRTPAASPRCSVTTRPRSSPCSATPPAAR